MYELKRLFLSTLGVRLNFPPLATQEVPEYLLTKTFRRPKMENVPTLPVLVTHAERF